jgi:deferrochelatase/peroxidase EfeB
MGALMRFDKGPKRRLTRRQMLGAGVTGGVGLALGAGGGYALGQDGARSDTAPDRAVVPFNGVHQAGIVTPAQDRLHFAAFDVMTRSRADVRDLLRAWSIAAERMCARLPAGAENENPVAPPDDTGEAFDLTAAHLTITIGLGPSLFTQAGEDRFQLATKQPEALAPLPPLPGDELDPDLSDGDLCVQACANDPQVAFHAVRNLTRIARGVAVMRWSQLGFGRTSTTSRSQATPRNLMGFKDGTNNILAEDPQALREHVWVGASDGPAWMTGGTYVVTRRIRMLIEAWDRDPLSDQENVIGRRKVSGAPLTGAKEHDALDLKAKRADGQPVIPVDAHVRLAEPSSNGGARLLRRGYSFTDGMDRDLGQLDAGLFFIAFQRDPRTHFIPIQRGLGRSDALNEYVKHTGSAVFAIPPGTRSGGWVGETLFG